MPSAKPSESKSGPQKQLYPSESFSQKTISELFATSKQGSKIRGPEDLPGASPSKRLKLNHSTTESDMTSATARPLQAGDRFNFSSPSRDGGREVIELTESPNGSPMKRKANNARPSNITTHTGPKKIMVKGLKKVSRPHPDEYYNRVWGQLDTSLSAIFSEQKLPYSMEELYRGVEIVCKQDRGPALYKKLCEKCTRDISSRVKEPLLQTADISSAVEVLDAVVQAWATWSKQMETIRSIFFYLDRSYLLHSPIHPAIDEMGTNEFRNNIFSATQLKPKILQGACDLLSADRQDNQEARNEALFCDAIKMFHSLTVYQKFFEPRLMMESEQYFLTWARGAVDATDLTEYVGACGKLFEQELRRCDLYGLDQTTKKGLETYLEDILVEQRKDRLVIVDDVGGLIGSDRSDAVSQLYMLLQRRRLGEQLRPAFEAFIVKQGSNIVFDEEREQEMVLRLLDFKKKLDSIWEHSFQRHEGLGHSLREAFETFINKSKRSSMTWGTDNPKPGEMIAKYVDMVLKGGTKAIRASGIQREPAPKAADNEDEEGSGEDEDVEIGKQLDAVLDLFRFVHGKAVFEAFYKRDLARRLLLGRSASSDAEKSMLTRLKSECGAGFTHNLEQMFKDIEMARDEISSYKSVLEERQTRPAFDLSVNVLSSAAWPSYPDVVINVPESVLKATASFEQHYKMKHSGRRLEWKHALAHCQLKALFPKGPKEIVVSCFQAVILMSFNKDESMTYDDLQAASGLDDAELKRTLQSLACARYRVLSKTPKGKDVNTSDSFVVNLNFSHPKYRIKINQIQAKETKQENQQTHERVAADRNYETQAAIVRIMKSRKSITHAELVSEVITATKSRGVLDPADIKKNIEKLIDKDYMERDEEGHNLYNYVA
ncbi:hypothetical protein N7G274_000049 [Stereocaulon virgatum]|uniref:Cullin family profile domain-containing protein n=1 Tax=Stereocaulon virgatum TaxID=373712 RepID=A0ABR4ASP3_9LECA